MDRKQSHRIAVLDTPVEDTKNVVKKVGRCNSCGT